MNQDTKKLPGLKERELIALGACAICKKPLLQGGGVTFYKVSIARAGVDAGAIKRRYGLQLALGDSEALARAFSPDDDLAKIFDGPHAARECGDELGAREFFDLALENQLAGFAADAEEAVHNG